MSLLDALLLDPVRIDVWVATRADGVAGTGTQTDPHDGSTLAKFDALMSGMAPNTCVHLGPGPFETAGFFDGMTSAYWRPKTGMRIVGSGIGVTTLKLVNNAASNQRVYAVATPLRKGVVKGSVLMNVKCSLVPRRNVSSQRQVLCVHKN